MEKYSAKELVMTSEPTQCGFDWIDIDKFRIQSFHTIKDEFEKLDKHIEKQSGLKSNFFQISNTTFTCKIVNKLKDKLVVSYVLVTMSDGISGAADLCFSFNKNDDHLGKNYVYSIISGDQGLLLRDQRPYSKYSYKAGSAKQLAHEMKTHLLKLARIQ